MKLRIFILLGVVFMIMMLFTGCAQPNDPEENDVDEVYLQLEAVYPSEGYVQDVKVTDDYVYVAEDEAGFSIWDNNNDTLLSRIRSYTTITGLDTTITVFSNIKLVAVDELSNSLLAYNKYGSAAGIHLYNIEDISNPERKFHHTGNIAEINKIVLTSIDSTQFRFNWGFSESGASKYYSGKFVSAGAGFWSVLGDQVGTFTADVADYNEDFETGMIYCASQQLGMTVFERPATIGEFDFPQLWSLDTMGQTIAVKVVDNIAYLGNREEGIQLFNISDFDNPIELFNYDTTGLASDIEVNAELNVFALASTSGGVYLFNGPQGDIRRLQRIDDSEIGYTYVIEMHGDLLYVGTRYGVYKYKIVNI